MIIPTNLVSILFSPPIPTVHPLISLFFILVHRMGAQVGENEPTCTPLVMQPLSCIHWINRLIRDVSHTFVQVV